MEMIERLCKEHTDLRQEEIAIIRGMASVLQALSNWEEADIFIDCPCREGDAAVVVAEAKPNAVPSSYRGTVVGQLARRENEPAVARTLRLGTATRHMKAVTQENGRTLQSVEPIKNSRGKVIGALIREQRLEEQPLLDNGRLHFSEPPPKQMADALVHLADGNNWLTECIDEGLLLVSRGGRIIFRNSTARDLYQQIGYVEDPMGQRYDNIRLAGSGEHEGSYEAAEVTAGRYSLLIKHIPLDDADIAFAVVMQDITWRRDQEKELVLRSVAVKEMHHRVKNNLQTIASLLRLQVRRSDDGNLKQVLEESINRILSIAATHELLSQSGVDQVHIGEVLRGVRNNAVRAFARPHFEINIPIEGDDFEIDSDIATAVALIINELLQNSLQYAFAESEKGQVRITVTRGELYSRIEVADNGVGYAVEQVRPGSLGLSIVQTMVKDKLHGSLSTESGPEGTRVSFDFKNQSYTDFGAT